ECSADEVSAEELSAAEEMDAGKVVVGKGKVICELDKGREISGWLGDSLGKDGFGERCVHVCKDSKVSVQTADDKFCAAGGLSVSVECMRPGKMHSLNKTCLDVYSL
ncbi:hypothetical protein FCV25MIE_08113, partial [Fagus crenata]